MPGDRVVLDTNVYISGIFWTGKPREIIQLAKQGLISAVISNFIIKEIEQILCRPDKPFKLNPKEITRIVNNIISYTTVVNPPTRLNVIKSDPSDNRILECAIEGETGFILSGDSHLKGLATYQGIKIISPDEYLKIYHP